MPQRTGGGAKGIVTEGMLLSRKYFESNRQRYETIIGHLDDKISKEIYKNQIEYRMTYDRKYSKPFNINNQYFPSDIIKVGNDEIFIDCGAFVGDSVMKIRKVTKGHYKSIVCFEPDVHNYNRLKKCIDKDKRIVIYNCGCWNTKGILKFGNQGTSAAKVIDGEVASVDISVCQIDEVAECQKASFIKMDIEGAEYNALMGAKNIIKNNRPILAISIYHSDEDMIRIPEMLINECEQYSFFVRQHSFLPLETVFYAVPNERKI